MTDNRDTQEAARVREKSEFIKRIEDFARYMQKKYIEPDGGRSLLISAGDRNLDGGETGGMAHIVLGDRTMNTAAIASMAKQECFCEMFRTANLVSTESEEDMAAAIRSKRGRLRFCYGAAAVLGAWTLGIVAMGVTGVMHWSLMLANLMLLAIVWLNLWREIRPLRRRIARLEGQEREARTRREMEAMLLDSLRRMIQRDEEDDDD